MTLKSKTPTERAVALLAQLNITKPPVPVEKIAKYLGAQIRFSPLDDEISGMVHVRDGHPIIGINSFHHPNRQRFSIAHELGHLTLHRSLVTSNVHVDKSFRVLMRDSKSHSGSDRIEIEANQFAAELLMPRSFLEEILADEHFDVDDEKLIETLAQRFRVSKQAMGHRISAVWQFLA